MSADFYPLRVLLVSIDGWMHRAIAEYIEHDRQERSHQGLDNAMIDRAPGRRSMPTTKIHREDRLGGLLRHDRSAA